MTKPTHNHVSDEGGDRKYYVQTPMLIWALVSDPYDLALWFTIKSIAWENGVCKLSTEDLATLSMMSVGKVSECRQRLLELGLIEGEVKRESNYPQPVWHLTIPDVWEENVAWAKTHSTTDQKIAHKTLQRDEKSKKRAAVKSLRQAKAEQKEPSPREEGATPREEGATPREEGTTPREEGTTPREEGTTPREAIKIYIEKEDLIEEKQQQQPDPAPATPSDQQPESSRHGRRQTDLAFAEVCKVYEDEIGSLTVMSADELGDLLDEHSKDWVIDAIRVAVRQNVRKLAYVSTVLGNWKTEGRGGKPKPVNEKRSQKGTTSATPSKPDTKAVGDYDWYAQFGNAPTAAKT